MFFMVLPLVYEAARPVIEAAYQCSIFTIAQLLPAPYWPLGKQSVVSESTEVVGAEVPASPAFRIFAREATSRPWRPSICRGGSAMGQGPIDPAPTSLYARNRKEGVPIMKRRIGLIAAVAIVTLSASTLVHRVSSEASDPAFSMTSPQGESLPITVAMFEDEGVPQNLVTRKR
jgi:hypothetical protein